MADWEESTWQKCTYHLFCKRRWMCGRWLLCAIWNLHETAESNMICHHQHTFISTPRIRGKRGNVEIWLVEPYLFWLRSQGRESRVVNQVRELADAGRGRPFGSRRAIYEFPRYLCTSCGNGDKLVHLRQSRQEVRAVGTCGLTNTTTPDEAHTIACLHVNVCLLSRVKSMLVKK